MTENSPARGRVVLTGISSRAWEHPADRGALTALRKVKGFDTLLRWLNGLVGQRGVRLMLLGGGVLVDERQFPTLHRLLLECCRTLDVERVPEMFVVADPTLSASCIGLDKPIIVLNSALVDLLGEEELRFVIGHELGHAESGHAVYETMLRWLLRMSGLLGSIPLGGIGFRVIRAGLLEWSRKAELSADRAGLLATQEPAAATRLHMQLASGGHLDQLDITSFLAQGQQYDDGGDLRELAMKVSLLENQAQPFAVVRATELRRWVDGGAYTAILGGDYPHREDDDQASVNQDAQEAARSYASTFERVGDSLGRFVQDTAGAVGSVKAWMDDVLRREDPPA